MKLRPYQQNTIVAVREHWSNGTRRVLVVAPTGAGKTVLAQELIGGHRALLVAHRRELVTQTAKRFKSAFGESAVGLVLPGERESALARIQVGTVQSLIARGSRPAIDLLVLDEAHHYMAADWRGLAEAYPGVPCVGLTATPQRADGEPLGDIFDTLVVAASYSELVRDGFLVPATVLRPDHCLGDDLAQDPIEAWLAHSGGTQTFMFAARVAIAQDWEKRLRDLGVRAATIHAMTPTRDREESLAAFRAGTVRVLCNVGTLTEGIDVPEAACVVLGRNFGHVGQYLQVVGRVLRTSPGKALALVIDLIGTSHRHGLPTDDRVYSLGERAISSGGGFGGGGGGAPEFSQKVKGLALRAVGTVPIVEPVATVPRDESKMRAEYQRLRQLARQHRMRDGFAAAKFKEKFGEWPRQEWA